jgi:hypothetical protein
VVRLKDGSTVTDRRLGRLPQWDTRNADYLARRLLTTAEIRKPRSYTWRVPIRLDQGNSSACVGHAFAHDLAARPKPVPDVTSRTAFDLYWRAQQLDPWAGGEYEGADPVYGGTSILAGAKAATEAGHYTAYLWAFTEPELAAAVGWRGPAVAGVAWRESMFRTDPQGFLRPAGDVVGGHAILINGLNAKGAYYTITNSWRGWGIDGCARIRRDDMAALLHDGGEACVPVRAPLNP